MEKHDTARKIHVLINSMFHPPAVCGDSPLTASTGNPLSFKMNSTIEALGKPGISWFTDVVARVACLMDFEQKVGNVMCKGSSHLGDT